MTTTLDDDLWTEFSRTLRSGTAKRYATALRALRRFRPSLSLKALDAQALIAFSEHLRRRGRKAEAIRSYLTALSSFATWAVANGYAATNPFEGLVIRRIADRERPCLFTWGQALAGIEDIRGRVTSSRDRALAMFLLFTGAPVGEVSKLELTNLDLHGRRARLRGQWTPLDPQLVGELTDYLPWRRLMFRECPWVFPTRRGASMTPKAVASMLATYGMRFRPRDLQDAFAQRALEVGTPLPVVQGRLGHRLTSTTAQYLPAARTRVLPALGDTAQVVVA